MPRVDPDRAVGALLGLAAGGGTAIAETALRLASSVIDLGGYDPEAARRAYGTELDRASPVTRTTPIGIAFAGREEALRDATVADAALTHFDPLDGKVALLHNQVLSWALTGGPELVFHHLKDPEWLDDRIEDVVIPATSGVRAYAAGLATSEPGSSLASLAAGLAAFFDADFERGLAWAIGLGGDAAADGAVTGALLGARLGAEAIPDHRAAAVERRREIESIGRRLAAMAG